jgi:hypothetical protein
MEIKWVLGLVWFMFIVGFVFGVLWGSKRIRIEERTNME